MFPWLILSSIGQICAAEKNTTIIDNAVYTQAQRLVPIERGRRLNIYCTGRGTPTVVFDSGLGDSAKAWGLVQPVVSAVTRACSYDRAGLGFSDPSLWPRTSANIVDDLHRLLRAAKIKPPYVLVGHSSGGINVKLYAETYLSEMAGMVLVDPSPEDLGTMMWAMDPASQATYAPYMESLQQCLRAKPSDFAAGSELLKKCVSGPDPRYSEAINAVELERGKQHARLAAWISEQQQVWFTSANQVRAGHRSFGDMPLIVLTHQPFERSGTETQELRDAKNQLWIRLDDETAAMSTRGTRRTVENSGHYIQLDQPQVVVGAILEVVRATSDRMPPTAPSRHACLVIGSLEHPHDVI
jgi:pimeloyl-ACP methyl ester carboxylesterase